MQDLNYQHLRYFWMTAREGSLTRAAERLRLAPSTVSVQVRALEESLGRPLFERRGRSLLLTEYGHVVKQYADDIFGLGDELVEAVRSTSGPRHAYRLRVGVGNNLPKAVAYALLAPAMHLDDFPVHLVCREDRADTLVADLAVHHLDIVITDAPVGLAADVRAESELLGRSGVSLMASPELARHYLANFPECLSDAPLLLPDTGSAIRRMLERWFEQHSLSPHVVGEFDDSALLKAFGQEGAGIFPVPTMVRESIGVQYRALVLGELEGLEEQFYACFLPSKRTNPAVAAILSAAQRRAGQSFG